MAKVEKKICYRPVPTGARIEKASDGKMYAIWIRDGKQEVAEFVQSANGPRIKKESEVYIACYRDATGRYRERSTRCRDKKAAENKLRIWLAEVEKIKGGILSPEEAEACNSMNDSIESHLKPFEEFLKSRCRNARYITSAVAYVRKICDACGFKRLRDMNGDAFILWLNKQGAKGMGARNRNAHRIAILRFASWAVEFKRLTANPFTKVPKAKEKLDIRHPRRALTLEEITKLFDAAERRPLHELTLVRTGKNKGANTANVRDECRENAILLGKERKLIYAVLIYTGLRKSELKSITLGQVMLDEEIPHIVLHNQDSKNGDGGLLPIHPGLLPHLREWIDLKKSNESAKPGDPLFHIYNSLCHVLTRDLAFAGIEKRDHFNRVVDVHALRHTHATVLHEHGVGLDVAQDSMRHSSVRMTLEYTHKKLPAIAKGIYSLPDLMDKPKEE